MSPHLTTTSDDQVTMLLAEERLLRKAISDPDSEPIDRVIAYARWQIAANRLKELATPQGQE